VLLTFSVCVEGKRESWGGGEVVMVVLRGFKVRAVIESENEWMNGMKGSRDVQNLEAKATVVSPYTSI
jgi:hypothetical protein